MGAHVLRARLMVALAASAGCVFGSWYIVERILQTSTASEVESRPHAVPVTVATAGVGDISISLGGLGTVTPEAAVAVKSEISGRLVKLAYEEGQMVKAGDFLAEIDRRPYELALEQAQAQLVRDQAQLKNANLNLGRYNQLVKVDSLPQQQRDAQESLVQQYEALITIDQTQINKSQLDLDYCRIKAPISGRIGLRLIDVGNFVSTGDSTGVVEITQLQPIAVIFPLAEDHLPQIMSQLALGKKMHVDVYDRTGKTILGKGHLKTADNLVDTTTGTVRLKALFDNKDLALFPNQFVNVRLLVNTLHDAVVIPEAAVQTGPSGPFVYVVDDDSTARVRPVKLGPADQDKIAISAGLKAGSRIVVRGADHLRDDVKVRVVMEPPVTASAEPMAGKDVSQ